MVCDIIYYQKEDKMCNCKATEIVLGLLIIIFAFWQTTYSQWIIVISAVLLLIHALGCKNCEMPKTKKPARKKKRRI